MMKSVCTHKNVSNTFFWNTENKKEKKKQMHIQKETLQEFHCFFFLEIKRQYIFTNLKIITLLLSKHRFIYLTLNKNRGSFISLWTSIQVIYLTLNKYRSSFISLWTRIVWLPFDRFYMFHSYRAFLVSGALLVTAALTIRRRRLGVHDTLKCL